MTAEVRTIAALWQRELLKMWSEPARIAGVVVQPLLFWLVIGSGFSPSFRLEVNETVDFQQFFYPGVLAMVILFCAIFSTMTVIEDRDSGFMHALLVAPSSRASLVVGKILGVVSIAFIQVALFLLVAPFAGISLWQTSWWMLLCVVGLGAFGLSALGFIFAWGTGSTQAYHALMSIVLIPMWILSGGLFPAQEGAMQLLVSMNPMGWLVAGLRAAFAGGEAPLGTVPVALGGTECVLLLAVFCCVMLWIGVIVCYKKR